MQKHTELWMIEVRRRDGTIQSIEQNYPALFQEGTRYLSRAIVFALPLSAFPTSSCVR